MTGCSMGVVSNGSLAEPYKDPRINAEVSFQYEQFSLLDHCFVDREEKGYLSKSVTIGEFSELFGCVLWFVVTDYHFWDSKSRKDRF